MRTAGMSTYRSLVLLFYQVISGAEAGIAWNNDPSVISVVEKALRGDGESADVVGEEQHRSIR